MALRPKTVTKTVFGHTLFVNSRFVISAVKWQKGRWSVTYFRNAHHNLICTHKNSSTLFLFQGTGILLNAFMMLRGIFCCQIQTFWLQVVFQIWLFQESVSLRSVLSLCIYCIYFWILFLFGQGLNLLSVKSVYKRVAYEYLLYCCNFSELDLNLNLNPNLTLFLTKPWHGNKN